MSDWRRTIAITLDLADIAEVWRHGSVSSSWLLDLTARALADDARNSNYHGDSFEDSAKAAGL